MPGEGGGLGRPLVAFLQGAQPGAEEAEGSAWEGGRKVRLPRCAVSQR